MLPSDPHHEHVLPTLSFHPFPIEPLARVHLEYSIPKTSSSFTDIFNIAIFAWNIVDNTTLFQIPSASFGLIN